MLFLEISVWLMQIRHIFHIALRLGVVSCTLSTWTSGKDPHACWLARGLACARTGKRARSSALRQQQRLQHRPAKQRPAAAAETLRNSEPWPLQHLPSSARADSEPWPAQGSALQNPAELWFLAGPLFHLFSHLGETAERTVFCSLPYKRLKELR